MKISIYLRFVNVRLLTPNASIFRNVARYPSGPPPNWIFISSTITGSIWGERKKEKNQQSWAKLTELTITRGNIQLQFVSEMTKWLFFFFKMFDSNVRQCSITETSWTHTHRSKRVARTIISYVNIFTFSLQSICIHVPINGTATNRTAMRRR